MSDFIKPDPPQEPEQTLEQWLASVEIEEDIPQGESEVMFVSRTPAAPPPESEEEAPQ